MLTRQSVLAFGLSFSLLASAAIRAEAGGFSFDPKNCPLGEYWLPIMDNPIPQPVTDTLCDFFKAQDINDYGASGNLLDPSVDRPSFDTYNNSENSNKSRIGVRGKPQRFVVDGKKPNSHTYQFVFREFYSTGVFRRSVTIGYENGRASIAGVEFGPF
jgi:hypothetical protein